MCEERYPEESKIRYPLSVIRYPEPEGGREESTVVKLTNMEPNILPRSGKILNPNQ